MAGSIPGFRSDPLHTAPAWHLLPRIGHVGTGALHKVSSPFETVGRSEAKANRWAAEHYLTADGFRAAFADGYTELCELVEYFDLPEEDIKNALHYWTECRGVDFNNA